MLAQVTVREVPVLVGTAAGRVMLPVVRVFGGATEPLFRVALFGWPPYPDELSFVHAVVGFVLVTGLGGSLYLLLIPVPADMGNVGVAPTNAAGGLISGALFLRSVEVGARFERDRPDEMHELTAWLAGAATYAVILLFGLKVTARQLT